MNIYFNQMFPNQSHFFSNLRTTSNIAHQLIRCETQILCHFMFIIKNHLYTNAIHQWQILSKLKWTNTSHCNLLCQSVCSMHTIKFHSNWNLNEPLWINWKIEDIVCNVNAVAMWSVKSFCLWMKKMVSNSFK